MEALSGTMWAELITSETVGIAIAVVLIILMRWLLPAASRGRARLPVAFLVLHLFSRVLLQVMARDGVAARATALIGVCFLFLSVGRGAVLLGLDVVLGPRLSRPLPAIFRDIIQGVVYLVLLFIALRSAGVEPGSLLTTSALLTAAIALSLQETLGNLVAGLAIQAQRPFDVDDWIQFDADPKHIGRVLEINWRATKVITLDHVEVVVPNATLAKAPISNFTKPTAASRRSLFIQVPAEIPPHAVRAAVLAALPGAFGVVASPPPSVVVNAFIDGNLEYWIRFFSDQFHLRDAVDSDARERVWYAFARADIPIAAPNRLVKLQEISSESKAADAAKAADQRANALSSVDFLRVLSDDQRRRLAEASRIRIYGPGEPVVKQGDLSSEMFILQSGTVVVQRERGTGLAPLDVVEMHPGEFFGEMALMTGEKRTATVRAKTPCTLIGVDHDALKLVLEAAPELANMISEAIAARQAEAEAKIAEKDAEPANVSERSSQLLSRIKSFFAL
jgi:small-conductance mechanosensitive channel/CRP-like cAMP-binding protein